MMASYAYEGLIRPYDRLMREAGDVAGGGGSGESRMISTWNNRPYKFVIPSSVFEGFCFTFAVLSLSFFPDLLFLFLLFSFRFFLFSSSVFFCFNYSS